ncbi:MAG: UxaA family hydrolase [Eubacterium sp.]|nr:UxaA family hydrolase [Eubacterium sp.]
MAKLFKINSNDNVAVALEDIEAGYVDDELCLTALDDIPKAHKILLTELRAGDNVIKYGYPIGRVTEDLPRGSYIHEHNLKTNLSDKLDYTFCKNTDYTPSLSDYTIPAYKRKTAKLVYEMKSGLYRLSAVLTRRLKRFQRL